MKRHPKQSRAARLRTYITTHRRRSVAIGSAAGLMLVLAVYGWYSFASWQQLDGRMTETRRAAKSSVRQLERQTHEVDDVARTVRGLRASINEMCHIAPIVTWQTELIAASKDLVDQCHKESLNYQRIEDSLSAIYNRVVSERKLSEELAALHRTLEALEPTDFDARLAQWKATEKSLNQHKTHESLASTREAALVAVHEIVGGYDVLIAANQAEDRAKFNEAKDLVEKGYSKLGAIQNHSVESYDELLDEFKGATAKLK